MSLPVACQDCGFDLYIPVFNFAVSSLGLYDDSRFPGRCILSLNTHYDDMVNIPQDVLNAFMEEARKAIKVIMEATGCARVNFAILGNRESHVHAHLIPRYPDNEEFPDCSPWNDQRIKGVLPVNERDTLLSNMQYKAAIMSEQDRV